MDQELEVARARLKEARALYEAAIEELADAMDDLAAALVVREEVSGQ